MSEVLGREEIAARVEADDEVSVITPLCLILIRMSIYPTTCADTLAWRTVSSTTTGTGGTP